VDEGTISADQIERWALDYLGRYATSAENLRRVLRHRVRRHWRLDAAALSGTAATIDAVVARHCCSGLIDDVAYAAQRAEALYRRGCSRIAIRARLIAKGIPAALADEALLALRTSVADPDIAAACALARRRRIGPYRAVDGDRARELAVFARAGFARRIAEAVLACRDTEAVEALARDGLD
jgi:regulatory protein